MPSNEKNVFAVVSFDDDREYHPKVIALFDDIMIADEYREQLIQAHIKYFDPNGWPLSETQKASIRTKYEIEVHKVWDRVPFVKIVDNYPGWTWDI